MYTSSNSMYKKNINKRTHNKHKLSHLILNIGYINWTRCILLSAIMIAVISISGMLIVKAADHTSCKPVNKYYTSITIQSDDTLWDIAKQYNSASSNNYTAYINEIKQLNNMSSDKLYAGQNILVYYYSDEVQ